jgi:ribosomal protein L40E
MHRLVQGLGSLVVGIAEFFLGEKVSMSFENGLLSDRPIPTCHECGKIVSPKNTRCRSCARKEYFRAKKSLEKQKEKSK